HGARAGGRRRARPPTTYPRRPRPARGRRLPRTVRPAPAVRQSANAASSTGSGARSRLDGNAPHARRPATGGRWRREPRRAGVTRRDVAIVAAAPPAPRSVTGSTGAGRGQGRWPTWVLALLVALVVFAAFAPALSNGFVNWDDDVNITDNPHFRGFSAAHLRWMFTTTLMGHYIPLTWLTLALDYTLWGMNPRGYHLTSV